MTNEAPILPTAEEYKPPEPTLEENLTALSQRTARLEAEIETIAGTQTYPSWWMQEAGVPHSVLRRQLQDPATDPKQISKYFEIFTKSQQLYAAIAGREYEAKPVASLCYELDVDTVAKGFAAEGADGPMHIALKDTLSAASQKRDLVVQELSILRQAYGKPTSTELLGIGRDSDYDSELRPLLRSESAIKTMRYMDEERDDNDTWHNMQARTRSWMGQALSTATGIDKAEAESYVFAASRRGEDKSLLTIIDRFEQFGAQNLREISKFTGIRAFETYSPSQLALMQELLHDPGAAAEKLSHHDVNVVMVNRVGDHNGVLNNTAEIFDDGNARTLFFEIDNMGDIYRHMLALQKLRVEPSTLVLAAHSAPGQFMVSDNRDPAMKRRDIAGIAGQALVKFVNNNALLEAGEFGYSMHGMKGMARLVEDLMQPSRALDDDKEDEGRKKILFQACNAATETEAMDVDSDGAKFSMGMDSVVQRLANDLASNNIRSNVDVYGAPAGIQLHKTERGVRYTRNPASFGEARQPQHAIRARLEEGKIVRQEVDEISISKS